jgi:tetratricopeptide (TPR) repeat protein
MAKPDFPLALALQSNLLVEQGNFKEAAASLTPALAAHPENAELLNSAGLLALAQKDGKSAEADFARSVALKPDYLDAAVNHAIAVNFLGRHIEAITEFQKALQAEPQNLKAQANLAAALFELRRYAEASSAFARAVELSPQDPDLHTNLGLALEKAGKPEQAKRAFAEAQSLRQAQRNNPRTSAN